VKLGTKTTQKLALHPEEAKRDPDKKNPAGYTGPLLLGGFMRCGHCGKTLQLESSGKDSREYRYYQCRTFCRQRRGACPGYGSRKGSSTLPSSNISSPKGSPRSALSRRSGPSQPQMCSWDKR